MQNMAKKLAAVTLVVALAWSGTATARGGFGGVHGGFHGFRGFRAGFFPGYAYGPWWGYPNCYYYGQCPADYWYYLPGPPPHYQQGVAYGPGTVPPPYSAAQGVSHHCATPQRICVLRKASPVGAPCTCRVVGGLAQGRIAPQ
jgi:hypothetical protein